MITTTAERQRRWGGMDRPVRTALAGARREGEQVVVVVDSKMAARLRADRFAVADVDLACPPEQVAGEVRERCALTAFGATVAQYLGANL